MLHLKILNHMRNKFIRTSKFHTQHLGLLLCSKDTNGVWKHVSVRFDKSHTYMAGLLTLHTRFRNKD